MVPHPPRRLHSPQCDSSLGHAEKSKVGIQEDSPIWDVTVLEKSPRSQYQISINRQQCSQLRQLQWVKHLDQKREQLWKNKQPFQKSVDLGWCERCLSSCQLSGVRILTQFNTTHVHDRSRQSQQKQRLRTGVRTDHLVSWICSDYLVHTLR